MVSTADSDSAGLGSNPGVPTPVGVTHRLVSGTIRREIGWHPICVKTDE